MSNGGFVIRIRISNIRIVYYGMRLLRMGFGF